MSDGTRTRDRRDHNPELYQLSYAHREGANASSGRRALASCGGPELEGRLEPSRNRLVVAGGRSPRANPGEAEREAREQEDQAGRVVCPWPAEAVGEPQTQSTPHRPLSEAEQRARAPSSSASLMRPRGRSLRLDIASSAVVAVVSTVPSARRVGCPAGSPLAARTSRLAAAPIAVAVAMKKGPGKRRLRDQTGTAVVASRAPV